MVETTITNNASGGQPVSMANIRGTKAICEKYGKPLIIDSARFAENAYFIKLREEGYQDKSIKEIVREMFSYADGMTMSAKKDTFSNMGGWLALNNDDWAERARTRLIMTEGFPTYGGLSGRDMECMAVGLEEIVHEDYLQYRIRSIQYINERLDALGVPVIKPAGGHAIFVDAKRMLPHIPPLQYPGTGPGNRTVHQPVVSARRRSAHSCSAASPTVPKNQPPWNWSGWPCRAACIHSGPG